MRATLPSGTEVSIAQPASGEPTMGLVVSPDIMGLRPMFDDFGQRIADEWGMTVAVVELFGARRLGSGLDERIAAVADLDDEAVMRDFEHAADMTAHARIGVMGFCIGGMYATKAAVNDRFARLASFYGMIRLPEDWRGPGQAEPLDCLAAGQPQKLLAIVAGHDRYTPPDDVAVLEATGATVVTYPDAQHAFAHAPEHTAYRADDAADAFARARDWLRG